MLLLKILTGGDDMPEMNILQTAVAKASELADKAGEGFVLAITAAYMAGIERGKAVAQTEPPAA